jgi:hypothetical protein
MSPVEIPWPPLALESDYAKKRTVPAWSRHLHLPLRLLMEDLPRPSTARAAHIKPLSCRNLAAELVEEFKIGVQDMVMVYISSDPYHKLFEQTVDLRKFNLSKHPMGGLRLYVRDGVIGHVVW